MYYRILFFGPPLRTNGNLGCQLSDLLDMLLQSSLEFLKRFLANRRSLGLPLWYRVP